MPGANRARRNAALTFCQYTSSACFSCTLLMPTSASRVHPCYPDIRLDDLVEQVRSHTAESMLMEERLRRQGSTTTWMARTGHVRTLEVTWTRLSLLPTVGTRLNLFVLSASFITPRSQQSCSNLQTDPYDDSFNVSHQQPYDYVGNVGAAKVVEKFLGRSC
eukprot:765577-Hanusia_phi.AAC.2